MDAIKIDLKAYSQDYYRDVVRGQLQPILDNLITIRKQGKWLEIVYLTVPTLNDRDAEIRDMSRWIKTELGPDVPIHFTRFMPLYLLKNLPPTPVPTLERLKAVADAEGSALCVYRECTGTSCGEHILSQVPQPRHRTRGLHHQADEPAERQVPEVPAPDPGRVELM